MTVYLDLSIHLHRSLETLYMTIIQVGKIFDPSQIDGQASLDSAIGRLDSALQSITLEEVDAAFLDLLDGPELVFELFLTLGMSPIRVSRRSLTLIAFEITQTAPVYGVSSSKHSRKLHLLMTSSDAPWIAVKQF
jgi:hypothetical protein